MSGSGDKGGCLSLRVLRKRLDDARRAQDALRAEMHNGRDTGTAAGAQLARANAHVEVLSLVEREILTGKGEERCYG